MCYAFLLLGAGRDCVGLSLRHQNSVILCVIQPGYAKPWKFAFMLLCLETSTVCTLPLVFVIHRNTCRIMCTLLRKACHYFLPPGLGACAEAFPSHLLRVVCLLCFAEFRYERRRAEGGSLLVACMLAVDNEAAESVELLERIC